MNEQITSAFIFYLAIFRLAMIAAGIASIILGYKLFARGVFPRPHNGSGTDFKGEGAGIKFKLKNAAPGTVFALFGAIIICVMYLSGPPEVTLENIYNPATSDSTLVSQQVKMRSDAANSLQAALDRAIQAQQANDTTTAISASLEAIKSTDLALNQAAWLLQAKGELDQANTLARTAVLVSPTDAAIRDTYAEILLKQVDYQPTLEQTKKAAELDSRYAVKVKKYREAYEKSN